ncbi:GAF domain-containing protein [Saccharomonospora xinjiangensis]|uniref:GAF domain-containing protein n=1 Tax=Saccharomonospora xinjiangensis TaxID=75294 RepID=UPI0002FA5A65|nr:GAF domain-containing protein [Saccharomonospora xinjiangensis]
MTQAPHHSDIDAAVAAEGLVSILGVPLLAGDEVLGALFAANRIPHTFTRRGDLAAVGVRRPRRRPARVGPGRAVTAR